MRLLMFGPQGVGKGTQAALLSALWGIPHISTGDMFRAAVAARGPLGERLAAIMRAGALVPDELTQALVADRLGESDATGGFLLDGFPRTRDQAQWLDSVLTAEGTPLDAVVVLTAPEQVLLNRAMLRGRADDRQDVVRRRLDLYYEQTEPLLDFFAPLVVTVNGNRPMADVHTEIVAAVTDRLPDPVGVAR